MPTILITGSQGFVGGAALRRFREAGWRAIGLGRRPEEDDDYLQVDLTQPLPASLTDQLQDVDVVLHAAARSSPWGSRKVFERQNVWATRQLAEACVAAGCPRLIFLSSSSVYYRPEDQFGIREATPFADPPVNWYAASKQRAEAQLKSYSGKLAVVTLRPRAVYGRGDTVLFPRILAAAKAGRLPLLTRPGEPAVGDLIAIDNLVERILQVAETPAISGDFNLTDNDPQPILEFLMNVFDQLGIQQPERKIPVDRAFRFAGVLETVYAWTLPWKEPPITRFGVHVFAYSKTFDVSKMLDQLGPPKLTTEQAIDDFVAWTVREDPYSLS